MNRTIKDATVERYHYDSRDQLRTHLADFMAACNFARRLETLSGLMPYEYICKIWTSEPDRFIINPIHQMPELNTLKRTALATPSTRTRPPKTGGRLFRSSGDQPTYLRISPFFMRLL